MKYKKLFSIILASLALYCFVSAFTVQTDNVENKPPGVTITTPLNNGPFQWNSIVNYSVSVSDKEDGSSEYNEISAGEVLLKVVYLQDSSKVKKYLSDKTNNADIEAPVLSVIKTSACFTCHAAKNKLIGPSFELIAKRYANNASSIETLAKKIMKGSTGVWGNIPMPANPDLKAGQAREIVSWILKNNMDSDVTYFTGTQGAFRTKQKPEKDAGKAAYILTATYTDHGVNGMAQLSKRGQQTIVLRSYQ